MAQLEVVSKQRKVQGALLNRGILLLLDFAEQLRRHGLANTASEISTIAGQLNASPELSAEEVLADIACSGTVH